VAPSVSILLVHDVRLSYGKTDVTNGTASNTSKIYRTAVIIHRERRQQKISNFLRQKPILASVVVNFGKDQDEDRHCSDHKKESIHSTD
jgi:hypothetical protein